MKPFEGLEQIAAVWDASSSLGRVAYIAPGSTLVDELRGLMFVEAAKDSIRSLECILEASHIRDQTRIIHTPLSKSPLTSK